MRIIVALLVIVAFSQPISLFAREHRTEKVILVTVDGLRVQELFGGIDETIINDKEKSGIENTARFRGDFWFDTPKERREALFPFFWKELIHQGVVMGNPALKSSVRLRNSLMFSYPGYAEILTGRPQPKIVSNMPIQSPVPTVLDFVKKQLNLSPAQVAAVCSWSVFSAICTHQKDSFFINAGYEPVPEKWLTDNLSIWNKLQEQIRTPWDTVRHDAFTFHIAMEWLKRQRPRLLYIGLGEVDDWAHARRYDRMIEAAHLFDSYIKQLWTTLQSMEDYQGKTTLIITTDHGRGVTTDDWTDHGNNTPGSEDIWIAVFGPDTPDRGELSETPTRYPGTIASTILRLFGLNEEDYSREAEPPLPEAFR